MSDPREPASGTTRAGWAALALVIALAIPALLSVTSQASFARMQPRAAVMPALAKRLVFIVVDGLRYDFATNPEYAPSFARNMQRHSNAEVWAGRVTMTSAATLAFGTGTRGTFTQVVLNVDARRTQANHLFDNARAAGLRSGVIGDPVWFQAYGEQDFQHLSGSDLALDVDDSPELFAVAHELEKSGRAPELLVVHFFATDHLQHSFGVFSPEFREFFRRFDQNLQKYLDALPEDTTVVVLSDHGALANGNHGVDSDLERKSPMFAYGPGIRPGQKLVLDQADIASTLAVLLGIASPAHGIGMPATELLDAPPPRLAELACNEAARIAEYGRKTAGDTFAPKPDDAGACSDAAAAPPDRIVAARARAQAWDEALAESSARRGVRGFIASIALLALFGGLFGALGGSGVRRVAAGVLATLAIAGGMVAITAQVDWTLPPWNESRAALMWIATALLGLACLWPALPARVYARAPLVGLCLAPGILYASFPTNTQLHAVIVAIVVWVSALVLAVRARRPRGELAALVIAGLVGCGIALRVGTVRDDALALLAGGLGIGVGVVLIALWLGLANLLASERASPLELLGSILLAALCVLPHSWLPAALGLALLAGLPIAAFVAVRRGRPLLGRALLMATYGLVSRPVELAAVLAAVLLAEVVGATLANGERALPARAVSIWPALVAATGLFVFGYVARLGVQGGLDFVTMDWSAGRFDSTQVRPARVAIALIVKYGAALSLVGFALLAPLAAKLRRAVVAIVTAGLVLRVGTLAAILFAPWVSFWSRYRMLGELGPTLIMSLLAAGLSIALALAARAPAPDLVVSPSRS